MFADWQPCAQASKYGLLCCQVDIHSVMLPVACMPCTSGVARQQHHIPRDLLQVRQTEPLCNDVELTTHGGHVIRFLCLIGPWATGLADCTVYTCVHIRQYSFHREDTSDSCQCDELDDALSQYCKTRVKIVSMGAVYRSMLQVSCTATSVWRPWQSHHLKNGLHLHTQVSAAEQPRTKGCCVGANRPQAGITLRAFYAPPLGRSLTCCMVPPTSPAWPRVSGNLWMLVMMLLWMGSDRCAYRFSKGPCRVTRAWPAKPMKATWRQARI